jgi:hypothetical protein
MNPEIANSIAAPFLAYGLPGAICLALAFYVLKLQAEMKSERAAHKVELAAKDAKIMELYDDLIESHNHVESLVKSIEKNQAELYNVVTGKLISS